MTMPVQTQTPTMTDLKERLARVEGFSEDERIFILDSFSKRDLYRNALSRIWLMADSRKAENTTVVGLNILLEQIDAVVKAALDADEPDEIEKVAEQKKA